MSSAYEGIIVTCDAALCQHIQHIDEQQQQDPSKVSFIVQKLDNCNLLVKPEAVPMIKAEIEVLQNKNHFSKANENAK